MTQKTFERVVVINDRLKTLRSIMEDITSTTRHYLNYNVSGSGHDEFPALSYEKRLVIEEIFLKHDKEIRKEIADEIDRLEKEIESL